MTLGTSLACPGMATVIMHAVVSVDGFIADENDDVGPLFEWYFNGDMPITDEAGEHRHGPFRVSGDPTSTSARSGAASGPRSKGVTCST